MKSRIIVFMFSGCLGSFTQVSSQVLTEIDSFFARSPVAIRTNINGTPITSNFPVYNRIVSRQKGAPGGGLFIEGQDGPENLDAYGKRFSSTVYLNQTLMKGATDFSLADFTKPFTSLGTAFEKNALFSWARFLDEGTFSRTEFRGESQFFRVAFDAAAEFKFCRFDGNAFFYGGFFKGDASFNDARFFKNAAFGFASFAREATFNRAEFKGNALFSQASFQSGADFSNAIFDSLADFSQVSFTGKLEFKGADLPKYLDLSGINDAKGTVELTKAAPERNTGICHVNLMNTDISKINMDYEKFRLFFPVGTTYEEKVKVYEDLLDHFKQRELSESYQALDIEFSQFKYSEKRQLAVSAIQKIWWNYGYDKSMIFAWIIYIILFFTIINTFFIRKLVTAITEMPFLPRKTVEKHHLHHPVIAYFLNFPGTLLYTFILIVSGSTGLSIIKDHSKIPNVVWMLYMIILSVVGTSLSLFIFNYIIN